MKPIQPVDLLVLLKLAAHAEQEGLSIRALADSLTVTKGVVDLALRRLKAHGIIAEGSRPRRINRLLARELLNHAVRWIAPAQIGMWDLGLPTAHAAEPLASKLLGSGDPVIIPLKEGPVRGRIVTPLHPHAGLAAQNDPRLHVLMSLVDALRIGGAREREVAASELRARL